MILKKRQDYLSLQTEERLFLVSELHMIRDALKAKRGEKKKRVSKARRRMRKPTMLSPKMLDIFDGLDDKLKEFVLYGKKE